MSSATETQAFWKEIHQDKLDHIARRTKMADDFFAMNPNTTLAQRRVFWSQLHLFNLAFESEKRDKINKFEAGLAEKLDRQRIYATLMAAAVLVFL